MIDSTEQIDEKRVPALVAYAADKSRQNTCPDILLWATTVISATAVLIFSHDELLVQLLEVLALISAFFCGAAWMSGRVVVTYTGLLESIRETLTRVVRTANSTKSRGRSGSDHHTSSFERIMRFGKQRIGQSLDLVETLDGNIRELVGLYENLTTNIAASVVIFNTDRQVTFCSAYTQVLTGCSPADLFATQRDLWSELVLDEDRERYLRAWSVSVLGEDIFVKYQIRHRSGIVLWLETRFVPITDDSGQVQSVMAVTVDLTDTLAQQKQIEEKNRDLQDFTYMVSHDLKAPIFTIKGMATALEEDYAEKLGGDGKELIQFIVDAAGRLEKLVSSVLTYSRLATQQAKEGEVPLSEVLKNVLSDFGQQMKDSHGVINISEMPIVRGDPVRIYQVFSNLIGNALKYRDPKRTPQINIRARVSTGDFAVIDVSDNGLGVPKDRIHDIFRPYQRAHSTEIEGSGIGLACVKKIVESAGGVVSVKSEEGVGSTFTVTIPLPPRKPQSVPEELARAFE